MRNTKKGRVRSRQKATKTRVVRIETIPLMAKKAKIDAIATTNKQHKF